MADGVGFAYVKATEGTTFQSSEYANQYDGAYDVGILRGAYHFARPDNSNASGLFEPLLPFFGG